MPARIRGAGAAEGEQHVAGEQQDLEADEEVEQVAGEEGVATRRRRAPGRSGGRSTAASRSDRRRPMPCPMARPSTPSVTVEATTSISADSRSATSDDAERRRPAADGDRRRPVASVRAARAAPPTTASTAVRTARLTSRWAAGARPTSRVSAAPSSGSSTGSGTGRGHGDRPQRQVDVVGRLSAPSRRGVGTTLSACRRAVLGASRRGRARRRRCVPRGDRRSSTSSATSSLPASATSGRHRQQERR